MNIIHLHIGEGYRFDHFELTTIEKLQPGELFPEDVESLEAVLRASKRNARRLAKLDAQTQ